MVDFHNPDVVKADYFALLNLVHCLDGVFLWDFFTTLDFEWEYITGKRKFRWTILLYSLSRLAALGTTVCNLVGFNVPHQINCQVWITWTLIMGYTSFACASALITLRVVAIWKHNFLVTVLTIGMWLTNVGFMLYGIVKAPSQWSPSVRVCTLENTFQNRDNITVTVATDFAQLIIMLIGLLRSRQTNHGIFRHLYVQGLIWLVVATVGELPTAIFVNLNLNDIFNMMFQNLALYTMQICATRMYRELTNYNMVIDKYSHESEINDELHFRTMSGRGTTLASTSVVPQNRGRSGFISTEDWELSDKSAAAIEDEKLTETPDLPSV